MLDVSPPRLARLIVDGTLIVADRDLSLEAGEIQVHGTVEAGSSRRPFTHSIRIVLDGNGPNRGVLSVAAGGRVELWGQPRIAWTRLSQTAGAGQSSLVLDRFVDWKAGDRVAIAPSGFDALETEERTLATVEAGKVQLDTPLRYRHWGTTTDGIDERAEVGLLSHDIVVTSDPVSIRSGLGGQVLVLSGGTLHASDVEFEGLGRRATLGAYPVHFHMVGDASGSFVRSSSIVHSFNRCLTVHGTHGVDVANNVAFDTIGHCYFLEDGVETGNVFDGNLGMLTRSASPSTAILESDLTPATFWITNPDNVVRSNVAAGSQGTGFWYDLSPHPTGPSADSSIWPRRTPLNLFAGNVAHSNEMNGLFVDILRNPPGVTEAPNYDPPQIADFQTFTSYKNRRRGAWLRGTKLRLTNAAIADNSIGVTFAGADAVLTDSRIVGETANATGPPKPAESDFPIRGFEFYDGQVGVERTAFVNFISNPSRRASALSALQFSPFFTDPTNYARALTFVNAEPVYFGTHLGARDKLGADGYRGNVFRDLDGSVTGTPNASVVLDTPLLADVDCLRHARWNALVCNTDYGSVFFVGVDQGRHPPGPVRVAHAVRPAYLTLYGNPTPGKDAIFQTSLREDREYLVTFANGFPRHLRVGLHHLPQGRGLQLTFPQAPHNVYLYDGRLASRPVESHRNAQDALTVDLVTHAAIGEVLDICQTPNCT